LALSEQKNLKGAVLQHIKQVSRHDEQINVNLASMIEKQEKKDRIERFEFRPKHFEYD
jgi:predicted phage gp36 major capsid-like protein